jgi:hypothetical protein
MAESGAGDIGQTKQQAIDALCEHFANDALSVEEFERRIDAAHKAESSDDLRKLLEDLPTGDLPIRRDEAVLPAEERARPQVPASRVKERSFMVAALGGVDRTGRWIPARQNYAFALLGGMTLDFREALLPPGETEVWIFSVLGGADIIVPPGLTVESDGFAILGGFDHREDAEVAPDPESPILRIRGVAVMGGVDVTVRYPGESAREAKRRRRHLKKERRRQRHRRLGDGS